MNKRVRVADSHRKKNLSSEIAPEDATTNSMGRTDRSTSSTLRTRAREMPPGITAMRRAVISHARKHRPLVAPAADDKILAEIDRALGAPADRDTMSSTHTPGPWIVSIDARYPAEPCVDAVIGNVVWHVALCHNGPGPEDTSAEANARLIAAAPELLAALKGALPVLQADLQRLTRTAAQSSAEKDVSALRTAKMRYDAAANVISKIERGEPPQEELE
jgi:hypothetical protein